MRNRKTCNKIDLPNGYPGQASRSSSPSSQLFALMHKPSWSASLWLPWNTTTTHDTKSLVVPVAAAAAVILAGLTISIVYSIPTPQPQPQPQLHPQYNSVNRGRFPKFGTPEFAQACPWTLSRPNQNNCTIMLRPDPNGHEGVADWVSKAATGFITAQLQGCHFQMDYGDTVDISHVLLPHKSTTGDNNNNNNNNRFEDYNWTIPRGKATCRVEDPCRNVTILYKMLQSEQNPTKIIIPKYRHAYKDSILYNLYRPNFQALTHVLPGFVLETGMACALERLWDLSPRLSDYQPNLFSSMLPTLDNFNNLVLTLYYRTGRTDAVGPFGDMDHQFKTSPRFLQTLQRYVDCAVQTEQRYLQQQSRLANNHPHYSKLVWLVVSDSPFVKQWITHHYTVATTESPSTTINNATKIQMPREIITTASNGTHTRTSRSSNNNTTAMAAFAQGMIDWYIMGESDVVLVNGRGYTFGTTAAQRTNRTVIEAMTCREMTHVHEETPPTWEEWQRQQQPQRKNNNNNNNQQ